MNYPKYWAEYVAGRRVGIYELTLIDMGTGYIYFKNLKEDGVLRCKKPEELERFDFIPFLIDGGKTKRAA